MSRRSWPRRVWPLAAILILAGCLALAPVPSLAAKQATVNITVVMNGPPATLLPAGDHPEHQVGLGQRTGKAVFSDGRQASYGNVFWLDYHQGRFANSWGYTKMGFADGSWIYFKWQAEFAGRDKAGKPTFKGTGRILEGTGPYQGIQGQVSFTNRQLPPSKEHPKGATQASAKLTYTLP